MRASDQVVREYQKVIKISCQNQITQVFNILQGIQLWMSRLVPEGERVKVYDGSAWDTLLSKNESF
jgi:hypothetical protein